MLLTVVARVQSLTRQIGCDMILRIFCFKTNPSSSPSFQHTTSKSTRKLLNIFVALPSTMLLLSLTYAHRETVTMTSLFCLRWIRNNLLLIKAGCDRLHIGGRCSFCLMNLILSMTAQH